MHGCGASSGGGYPQLAAYPAYRILLTYSAAAEFHEHGHGRTGLETCPRAA